MKLKLLFTLSISLLIFHSSFGQKNIRNFSNIANKADSLYKIGNYLESLSSYNEASRIIKNSTWCYYGKASCWVMINNADSAFYYLDCLKNAKDTSYVDVSSSPEFTSLHNDKRWPKLLAALKINKEDALAKLNKPLIQKLDSIRADYGKSELTDFGYVENTKNFKAIIKEYGWPRLDAVGNLGYYTLYLTLSNASDKTKKEYLPMILDSIRNRKEFYMSDFFARLMDEQSLKKTGKQIYGTSIKQYTDTNLWYIEPINDPENVDKRRAEIGIQSLADFIEESDSRHINLDKDQYKKSASSLEERIKRDKKIGTKKLEIKHKECSVISEDKKESDSKINSKLKRNQIIKVSTIKWLYANRGIQKEEWIATKKYNDFYNIDYNLDSICSYFKNGHLKNKAFYTKEGSPKGEESEYYENGKLKCLYIYDSLSIPKYEEKHRKIILIPLKYKMKKWDENGILRLEGEIVNGKRYDLWSIYDKQGVLRKKKEYIK